MAETTNEATARKRNRRLFFIIIGLAVIATVLGVAFLMNIFERKQEARNPFYRVVELTDETEDPAIWGKNFPLQYDDYKRTVDQVRTRYGGSEALPRVPTKSDPRAVVSQSKLEEDPRLKQMWWGYAFAVDFREERGHAFMLDDQTFTERQGAAKHAHILDAADIDVARHFQVATIQDMPDVGLAQVERDVRLRSPTAAAQPIEQAMQPVRLG